jgi:hypothetical protein
LPTAKARALRNKIEALAAPYFLFKDADAEIVLA